MNLSMAASLQHNIQFRQNELGMYTEEHTRHSVISILQVIVDHVQKEDTVSARQSPSTQE